MRKLCLAFASVLMFLIAPSMASANHFRSGTLSWSPVNGEDKTVLIKAQVVWTNDHGHISTGIPIGGIAENKFTIFWGDGESTSVDLRVISRDATSNDVFTEIVSDQDDDDVYETTGLKHTYDADGDYIAYWSGGARESAGAQTSSTWRNETTINIGTGNVGPVTAVPAIVQVRDNTEFSYQLAAADSNGDDLQFRLGTQQEFYQNGNDANVVPPDGLTISSTGLIEWDVRDETLATDLGDRWQMTVMVEDLDNEDNVKSKSPLDFVLLISDANNEPPVIEEPEGGTTQEAEVGETITTNVSATDPDWEEGDNSPSITALNPPSTDPEVFSAELTQDEGDADFDVSFTPTEDMAGNTYVVNFQITDGEGGTTVVSRTFQVPGGGVELNNQEEVQEVVESNDDSGGGSGKAKTIRWRGMKRGELLDFGGDVTKHNYDEYYAKSKDQIAKMNEGIAPEQKYVVNRWGEHVFAGYLAGRIGLDRFPYRFQNVVKFGSGSLTAGRGINRDAEENANQPYLASAPKGESIEEQIFAKQPANEGWADEYQYAKDRFTTQKVKNEFFASAPESDERTLTEDQVVTHENQRNYYRKKGIPDRQRDTSAVRPSRMDATKDMGTIKIRFGGKSTSVSNYLKGLQSSVIGNYDDSPETGSLGVLNSLGAIVVVILGFIGIELYRHRKKKKTNTQ